MDSRLLWGIFLYAGLVTGCALNPSVDTLTGEQRAKFDTLQIVRSEMTRLHKSLGSVSAFSCQKDLSDARLDTEEAALEKIKIKALLLGADAVINTTCQNAEIGLLSTCWSVIECSGDAVQFTDASR